MWNFRSCKNVKSICVEIFLVVPFASRQHKAIASIHSDQWFKRMCRHWIIEFEFTITVNWKNRHFHGYQYSLSLALYRPHTRHLSSFSHRSIFQCIVPAVVIVICLPVTSSHTCHGIRSDCLSSVFDGMLMPMPSARDFFAIFIRHPVNILMAAFSALVSNNTNTDIDRENERGNE